MKILAIETSCDETAISILEAEGQKDTLSFSVLGNALYSQASKHATYGGVYPNLAKREHAANLVPLLDSALSLSTLKETHSQSFTSEQYTFLEQLLVREERLYDALHRYLAGVARPAIDAIAVTQGPGLEPALWVGINFARALAYVWGLPIIPVNHLEGHMIASAVVQDTDATTHYTIRPMQFPALGLILSGGHTEFIYARAWGDYEVVGATRDDSIGEAFDKVARLLGIPYPGGPGLSALAAKSRLMRHMHTGQHMKTLPRPMLRSDDLDFSFSGLKTAVRYLVRDLEKLTDDMKARIAAEFEEAVAEVVLKKTERALQKYTAHTFAIGGGVSANMYLRTRLEYLFKEQSMDVTLMLPAPGLSTDNAIMIGMAGYLVHLRNGRKVSATDDLFASGNMSIAA